MSRGLHDSWAQACRLGGQPGAALMRTVEAQAKEAAAEAVELAREAVEAADEGYVGDAVCLIIAASSEAHEVQVAGWDWWLKRRRAA